MRRVSSLAPFLFLVLSGWLASGCASTSNPKTRTDATLPPGAEAWSLLGQPLQPPPLPPEVKQPREVLHSQAEVAWQVRPGSADTRLSLARRLMDLARFREAIPHLDKGFEAYPSSAYFPRFRAEAHLALRHFDLAAADASKALELFGASTDTLERSITPGVSGEAATTYKSSLQTYLGLARYAQGDFDGASKAFRDGLSLAKGHDSESTARLWLYLSLLAESKSAEATAILDPVEESWRLAGDPTAHRLLLHFRGGGDAAPLLATAREGRLDLDLVETALGLQHLARGERGPGVPLLHQVIERGNWPSHAALLAEVQLARLGEKAPRRPKG